MRFGFTVPGSKWVALVEERTVSQQLTLMFLWNYILQVLDKCILKHVFSSRHILSDMYSAGRTGLRSAKTSWVGILVLVLWSEKNNHLACTIETVVTAVETLTGFFLPSDGEKRMINLMQSSFLRAVIASTKHCWLLFWNDRELIDWYFGNVTKNESYPLLLL